MKTQLQKMKMLTVLLAVAGMLFSGSAFAAISISGSLTVTSTGANTANTIANPPLGVLVTALRYSGTPAVVVGSYPTYTNAAGNYAFSGLPISGSDYYVVRASAPLYYGAPYNNGVDTHITANTAGANLTLVFNKFAFNGGSGSFPLWEQFLSSATIDGANLVDGDQIGVWDASSSRYVGLMIITRGLVTSNVFDQTNNLVSYSKLSGAGNPAGYASGATSAYRLWPLGAGAYSGANVTAVRSNIDGVCWMTNLFPATGLYAHSVTSLQFYTGTLRKLSGKVKDAFTTLNINGATVTCGGYSFISAGTGDYDLGTNFVDGTSYSATATKTGYTSGTESGTIVGNTTKNILLTPTGGISGHVVLAGSGDGVAGVTVTATYGAYSSSAVTDVYGGYAISGISNYTYTLSATKTHYTTGNSSAVVANGTITTGVDLTISYSESLWADVTGDPDKTWTIYLAQAKLNGVDLAPNDEIAVFDNSSGKIAGRYTLTGVLTSGAALSHDMIAFEDIGLSGQGYTVNSPYTFKCYQRSTSTIYYLESFSIDPARSSWTDADHAPSASNPTKYTTVALNFTNLDPSNYSQSIYLKQGISWVSSYIVHNTTAVSNIIPATMTSGQNGSGAANTGSNLQYVKNNAGDYFRVLSYPPGIWTNDIGNWVNTEGYVFVMNTAATLTITGTRVDPATVIDLNNSANPAAGFFLVGNLLTNPINAATAFSELLSGGILTPAYTQYIKNSAGRMFWNISGALVNNIGNIVPGEAYQFLVTAGAHPNFRLHSTKSGALITEDYNATHFLVSGNAADNVFTVYVKTSDFAAGDEIAAFDGNTLVGATKLISTSGTFDNPIPAFMTLSTGEGYKVGNPITLKAWSASENKEYDVTYTLDNTDGAYYNTVYPNGDGKFCIATVTKGALGINDASPVVANVFPNPAHEYLKVVADRTIDNIYLMNIVGQKVAEKSVNGTSTQLNLSGITSGVYFLRIECNGQVSTQKVLIN
ncbi:MAG: T9SS type A sorting domain-containing protein [Bacteroidota bacterium]